MVATSEEIAVLDAVQYLDDGPCVHAVEVEEVVEYNDDDVLDERAWAQFARATAAARISSTLTLPVLSTDRVVGSVNLYARSRHAFEGLHDEMARIFHAWAPGAVTNADLSFSTRTTAEDAPQKLRGDVDIQVAVGLLAAVQLIDVDAARTRLLEASRRAGVTEADLAASIIEIERSTGAGLTRTKDRPPVLRPWAVLLERSHPRGARPGPGRAPVCSTGVCHRLSGRSASVLLRRTRRARSPPCGRSRRPRAGW